MTQNFKGDALELQIQEAGAEAFDRTELAVDQFLNGAFESGDFLLMLYDSGRMPFSARVPRTSFLAFLKQFLPNAPFTGTFESYLFILKAIFGDRTEVLFDVPAPGKLEMVVNVEASLEFDFEGREFVAGAFQTFTILTDDGEQLQFRGLAGIDSEPELQQLLSELIPVGIYPDITLTVFTVSFFVAEDEDGNLDSVVDQAGNQIIFFELGA